MKKLMSVLAGVLFACVVFACTPPDGYSFRQKVTVYNADGESQTVPASVYHATNACDAYCVCFKLTYGGYDDIYYVSKSDKGGYNYMFWYYGKPYYFNM